MYIYVYICIYICMYVYVCMYGCIYMYIYVCIRLIKLQNIFVQIKMYLSNRQCICELYSFRILHILIFSRDYFSLQVAVAICAYNVVCQPNFFLQRFSPPIELELGKIAHFTGNRARPSHWQSCCQATNTFLNSDKYICQFGQIHFLIISNTFSDFEKYSFTWDQARPQDWQRCCLATSLSFLFQLTHSQKNEIPLPLVTNALAKCHIIWYVS